MKHSTISLVTSEMSIKRSGNIFFSEYLNDILFLAQRPIWFSPFSPWIYYLLECSWFLYFRTLLSLPVSVSLLMIIWFLENTVAPLIIQIQVIFFSIWFSSFRKKLFSYFHTFKYFSFWGYKLQIFWITFKYVP